MKLLIRLLIALFAPLAMAAPSVVPLTVVTAHGPATLKLELACTPATREHGLMQRTSLAPNDGMLFVFPDARRRAFWMKNTPMPLDILYVSPEGSIVHIARHTTPYSEAPIDSTAPANATIELKAGDAKARGIAPGDKVNYRLPEGTHVE